MRFFAFAEDDLSHVEAPREVPGAEQPEPFVCPTLHELLFPGVDSLKGSTESFAAAGFDFYEGEGSPVAGYDVDFSTPGSLEVPVEDPATLCFQVGAGYFFPEGSKCDVIAIGEGRRTIEQGIEFPAATEKEGPEHG